MVQDGLQQVYVGNRLLADNCCIPGRHPLRVQRNLVLAASPSAGQVVRSLNAVRCGKPKPLPFTLVEAALLQGGEFAQHTLSRWTNCQLFYLIDPTLQHTSSHSASAGGEEEEQEEQRQQAHDLLEPWENKTGGSRCTCARPESTYWNVPPALRLPAL